MIRALVREATKRDAQQRQAMQAKSPMVTDQVAVVGLLRSGLFFSYKEGVGGSSASTPTTESLATTGLPSFRYLDDSALDALWTRIARRAFSAAASSAPS